MKTKTVSEYYDVMLPIYRTFYSKEFIHFGLWDKNTKNMTEALQNMNKKIVEALQIKKTDKVLDAGCGFGGTSFYIAEKYEAKVIGITISEEQLKAIKKIQTRHRKKDLLEFIKMDFTDMKFEDKFDKIFFIESFCYAEDKINQIKDIKNNLKKEGRFAIADAFLTRENLTEKEKKQYKRFCEGLAVPNLIEIKKLKDELKKEFKNIQIQDVSHEARRTLNYLNKISTILTPLFYITTKLGITSKIIHKNFVAGKAMKPMVKTDLVRYLIITGENK